MAELSYKDQQDLKNIEKIREHLQILPRFCGEYFRSLEAQIPVRTTLMIWVYFFIFLRLIIPILRIKTYIRCLLRFLI